jgi:hypothetical protein
MLCPVYLELARCGARRWICGGLVAEGRVGEDKGLAGEGAKMRQLEGERPGERVVRLSRGEASGSGDHEKAVSWIGGIRLQPAMGEFAASELMGCVA